MSTQQTNEVFEFDDISEAAVAKAVAAYPAGRQMSAVKTLLDIAQRQMGRQTGSAWLPQAALDLIAARLEVPRIRVYENVTFYSMFNTKPVGKYHLQICTTTPCWLRGSEEIVNACKKFTGISDFGGTSDDGLFTLTEVECLGACVNAPIIQINDDYHENLDAEQTEATLAKLKDAAEFPPLIFKLDSISPASALKRASFSPVDNSAEPPC